MGPPHSVLVICQGAMADLQCKQWKGIRDFHRSTTTTEGGAFPQFSALCHECEDPLDFDLFYMDTADLIAEAKKLRAGIRTHRDSTGHALCWFANDLWNLVPEKVTPCPIVPPEEEFIAACRLYRKSLDEPQGTR